MPEEYDVDVDDDCWDGDDDGKDEEEVDHVGEYKSLQCKANCNDDDECGDDSDEDGLDDEDDDGRGHDKGHG